MIHLSNDIFGTIGASAASRKPAAEPSIVDPDAACCAALFLTLLK